MATALNVANYILTLSEPYCGDVISNLHMQKLLYYCQGFHLAIHDAPLFDDGIARWDLGPHVPMLYPLLHPMEQYADSKQSALSISGDFDDTLISKIEKEIIDEVFIVYGQFSAWKLREMVCNEPPWAEASRNEEITHKALREFFKTRVVEE